MCSPWSTDVEEKAPAEVQDPAAAKDKRWVNYITYDGKSHSK